MSPTHTADTFPATQIEFRGHDNVRLVADTYGDPSQRPVLLMHGGGQTRHAWKNAARELARHGWYAVNLDHRGHGDSDWSPDGNYRPTQFCGDIDAIVTALGSPPVAIGASLGGLVSLIAQGRSEQTLFSGIVLVDIVPRAERQGVNRIIQFMRERPDGFADLEEAADAVAAYMPERPRPKDTSGLRKNLRQREDGRWIWHWDPAFVAEDAEGAREMMQELLVSTSQVEVPTLLVRGLKSDVVSDEGVADLQRRIPHAEYADVRSAGHMVAGDKNDVFNSAVISWLDRTFGTS